VAGEVRVVANPVRFSATPARSDQAPPCLGQHTTEILGGLLGIPDGRLGELRDAGIV
jgi:crotonobetainyl-CoA:carnitine CoA-transferase CaiB-like acyl-CoA transferase